MSFVLSMREEDVEVLLRAYEMALAKLIAQSGDASIAEQAIRAGFERFRADAQHNGESALEKLNVGESAMNVWQECIDDMLNTSLNVVRTTDFGESNIDVKLADTSPFELLSSLSMLDEYKYMRRRR